MNNKAVGATFIMIAVILAVLGYKESRATGVEAFATGMGEFVASVDREQQDRLRRDLAQLNSERTRRGIPFWLFVGGFGLAGIGFILRDDQVTNAK